MTWKLLKLFEENRDEIAGVILEPVVGNAGFIVPDAGFLEGLATDPRAWGFIGV